jgi:hypothetical protein
MVKKIRLNTLVLNAFVLILFYFSSILIGSSPQNTSKKSPSKEKAKPQSPEVTTERPFTDPEVKCFFSIIKKHPEIIKREQEVNSSIKQLDTEVKQLENDLKKPIKNVKEYNSECEKLLTKNNEISQLNQLIISLFSDISNALSMNSVALQIKSKELNLLSQKIPILKKKIDNVENYQKYAFMPTIEEIIADEKKEREKIENEFEKPWKSTKEKFDQIIEDIKSGKKSESPNLPKAKSPNTEQTKKETEFISNLLRNPLLDNDLHNFSNSKNLTPAAKNYIETVKAFYEQHQKDFHTLPIIIKSDTENFDISSWHLAHVFLGSLEPDKFKGLHYYGEENKSLFCALDSVPQSVVSQQPLAAAAPAAADSAAADKCKGSIYIGPIFFASSSEDEMQDGFVLYKKKSLEKEDEKKSLEKNDSLKTPSYFIKRCTFFPKNMSISDCITKISTALKNTISKKNIWTSIQNFEFFIDNPKLKINMGYNFETGSIETFFPTNDSFQVFEKELDQDEYNKFIDHVKQSKDDPKKMTYDFLSQSLKNVREKSATPSKERPSNDPEVNSENFFKDLLIDSLETWQKFLKNFMEENSAKLKNDFQDFLNVTAKDIENYINFYFREKDSSSQSAATEDDDAPPQENKLKIDQILKHKKKVKEATQAAAKEKQEQTKNSPSSSKSPSQTQKSPTPIQPGALPAASSSDPLSLSSSFRDNTPSPKRNSPPDPATFSFVNRPAAAAAASAQSPLPVRPYSNRLAAENDDDETYDTTL